MKFRISRSVYTLTLFSLLLLGREIFGQIQPRIVLSAPLVSAPLNGNPSDVTVLNAPRDLQLYQRSPNTNKANVMLSGTVDGGSGYSQILVHVNRNDLLWNTKSQILDYAAGDAPFQIEFEIAAERADYDFTLVAVDDGGEDTILTATDVAAGDLFLVNGQSNANAQSRVATDRVNGTIQADVRKYIRSYGSREDTGNETDDDEEWHPANGDSNWGEGAIGQWAMRLGQRIVEDEAIPVAFLNGAVSGTRIFQHQRNNANPDDLNTIYGRLLWRTQSANIAGAVRALFWYQGESDQQKGVNYTAEFDSLYNGWKADYAGLERIYLFQIRNTETTCGPADIVLREEQRRLADTYTDVSVMSTTAVDQQIDGCHFPYQEGYRKIGDHIYGLVARDFYARGTQNVEAPNADYAYFSNDARTEVTLVMRNQNDTLAWGTGSPHLDFRLEGNNMPAITAGSASGHLVTLTLDGDGSGATGISYLGHSDDLRVGEWVTNLNGIGLLAFYNLPIGLPPAIALDAPVDGAIFAPDTTIQLRAAASDADGNVTTVAFMRDGQLLGNGVDGGGGSWRYSWEDAQSGSYRLTAVATDDDGIESSSTAATIRVNARPTVSLTLPAENTITQLNQPLLLRAAPFDSDGSIAKVAFYAGNSLVGSVTNAPWEINWTPTSSGIVQLTAIASDNDQSDATSQPVSIRINAPPTVEIRSPLRAASFVQGVPIEILVDAADSDGTVQEVRFYTGSTLLFVDSQAPWVYSWPDAAVGTHQLTAAAVDNDGTTSDLAAQVGIAVVTANATPTNTPTPSATPTATGTPSAMPTLTIVSEATGAPGSRFVLEGHNFDANVGYSLAINGVQLAMVRSGDNGTLALELVTNEAMPPGQYLLSIIEVATATTQFVIDADAEVQLPSSGYRAIIIPSQNGDQRIYLPAILR